jgi:hypothetical protein
MSETDPSIPSLETDPATTAEELSPNDTVTASDPLEQALLDIEKWKDLAYRSQAELDNFRKREGMIAFLYTDDPEIKLSSWRWRRVLITGEEYVDARWPKSAVIKVTAIQPAY